MKIALRTLTNDQRSRTVALLDCLRNWDNDKSLQERAKQTIHKNVHILPSSDGTRIFFSVGPDSVTVLEVARKETIDQFAKAE